MAKSVMLQPHDINTDPKHFFASLFVCSSISLSQHNCKCAFCQKGLRCINWRLCFDWIHRGNICESKVFDLNIWTLSHKKQLLMCLGASEACDYSGEYLRNVDYDASLEMPGGHKESDQSVKQEDSVWIFQTAVACEATSEDLGSVRDKMQKAQAKTLIPPRNQGVCVGSEKSTPVIITMQRLGCRIYLYIWSALELLVLKHVI